MKLNNHCTSAMYPRSSVEKKQNMHSSVKLSPCDVLHYSLVRSTIIFALNSSHNFLKFFYICITSHHFTLFARLALGFSPSFFTFIYPPRCDMIFWVANKLVKLLNKHYRTHIRCCHICLLVWHRQTGTEALPLQLCVSSRINAMYVSGMRSRVCEKPNVTNSLRYYDVTPHFWFLSLLCVLSRRA